MGLFGKKSNSRQSITKTTAKVRDCQAELRQQKRLIDRHIFSIRDDEDKTRKLMREMQKNGLGGQCQELGTSIVKSRRTIRRLENAKLNVDMVVGQLDQLRNDMRLTGAVETSSEVLTGMTELIRVPELAKSMKKTVKQLVKLGILAQDQLNDVEAGEEDRPSALSAEEEEELSRILDETTIDRSRRSSMFSKSVSVDVPVPVDTRTSQQLPAAAAASSSKNSPKTSAAKGRRSMSVIEKKTSSRDGTVAVLA